MFKKIGYFFTFGILALWLSYNFYYGYNYNKELEEFGIVTIGKITKFKGAAKSPYLNFKFFIDGNSYGSDSPRDNNGEKIGQFYKVIYSSKNPEICRIYLDEPVTDTISILKAGFSRDEISKMPN
jgi:hypothetical protein